jgi:uncharacterized protein
VPEEQPKLPFDQDLFDLLVCPEARMPLKFVDGKLVSTDPATRRAYRVDDGIPVMLIEESQALDQGAWQALMAQAGPVGGGVAAVRGRSAQPGSSPPPGP